MSCYRWENQDLTLFVHVQPRANQSNIIGIHDDKLKIKVCAAPTDGKANEEVCKLLAKTFGVAKSNVVLLSGHTSHHKRLCIHSPKKLPDFITPAKL